MSVSAQLYWEAVRQLAEPFELMKFTLIYDGDLPSSGNNGKPIPASRIRNELHHQLADLWDTSIVLRELARSGYRPSQGPYMSTERYPLPEKADIEAYAPLPPDFVRHCAPIPHPGAKVSFLPLVRKSLYLACAVDVLFLRHEEPFQLMRQGGDIDGRMKTLFDALKMPNPADPYVGDVPTADPLYVVLEDDALISDISVKSGRLLGDRTKNKHAVRLTIDVTIKPQPTSVAAPFWLRAVL